MSDYKTEDAIFIFKVIREMFNEKVVRESFKIQKGN